MKYEERAGIKISRPLIAIVAIVVTTFIWVGAIGAESDDHLTVAFLDVGQGDAIFIETPGGRQVLIDGGVGRLVTRELGRVMPFYDRSIDMVIATHADADHVGGLPFVLERFHVASVIEGSSVADSDAYSAWERGVASERSEYGTLVRGQVIHLDEEVEIIVLFPTSTVKAETGNAGSLVMKLVYGETSFLLTGDAPSSVEEYLVARGGSVLDSDVLKVGHHGSRTSTSDGFVKSVSPEVAVISAGEDNRYGHPHQEVLDVLAKNNVEILCTCEVGAIVFESDGTDVVRSN